MEINDFRIKCESLNDKYFIEPIGDFHVGNINCNKQKLKERIDYIKRDPKRYTIIMGDLADSISMDDKRYDLQTLDPLLQEPDRQYEYVMDILEPIKTKIIAIHCGNHDETLRKKIALHLRILGYSEDRILRESDWVKKVCKKLGVSYAGFSSFTRLTFDKGDKKVVQFKMFSTHGAVSGGRNGNNINKLEDLSKSFDADIYLMGHSHNILDSKDIHIGISQRGKKPLKIPRVYGGTGGFLEGYITNQTSYVEQKLLTPKRTGTITVSIQPNPKSLSIFT